MGQILNSHLIVFPLKTPVSLAYLSIYLALENVEILSAAHPNPIRTKDYENIEILL